MAKAKAPQDDPSSGIVVTTEQAAKLLMISRVYLNKLHKMEYIPKRSPGRWNLVEVVQGHIRYLKDDNRRATKSAAHSRMTDVKTERLEMQVRAERRELVPVDDHRLVLDTAASLVQSRLMAVPSKFTRNVAERRRLEQMIAAAINEVADGMEKKATALKKGEDVVDA